jgi:hypothetical protein
VSKKAKPAGSLDGCPKTEQALNDLLRKLESKSGTAGNVEEWLASESKELFRLLIQEHLEQQEKP